MVINANVENLNTGEMNCEGGILGKRSYEPPVQSIQDQYKNNLTYTLDEIQTIQNQTLTYSLSEIIKMQEEAIQQQSTGESDQSEGDAHENKEQGKTLDQVLLPGALQIPNI